MPPGGQSTATAPVTLLRPGTVRRSSLIERLSRDDPRRIVSVVAPPGYGKTTFRSQWAERNGQAFAWVSVDEKDNDPKVLLTYVAEALDAVEPIDGRVFDALASPQSSVPGSVGRAAAADQAVAGRREAGDVDMAARLVAAVLFLSPNTVKSQAYSLCRKLGASSRSQAVAWSRDLALLER